MNNSSDKQIDPTSSESSLDAKAARLKRMQLAVIMGMVIVPMVVSYFMFYTGIGIPTHTVNHGAIVATPVALGELDLVDDQANAWNFRDQGLVFQLVQVVDGDCTETCQQLLYVARQLNTRLGKNAAQLQRVMVHLNKPDQSLENLLKSDYPNVVSVAGRAAQWRDVLSTVEPNTMVEPGERLYLVDRRDFLVMYYTADHDGGEILKDLNHLIKTVQ